LKRLPDEVAVFVRRGDQLLICHRVAEDYWHIIAGALEPGESYAKAAKRELREETGLVADPEPLGVTQSYALTDAMRPLYSGDAREVVVENFVVEAPAGWEPTLNDEHDGYRWASLAVAADLMYWPETRETIAVLARRSDAISG
jgi:8-oxo-dGTP pyrophosphatase MutT (NUDIX family)